MIPSLLFWFICLYKVKGWGLRIRLRFALMASVNLSVSGVNNRI